MVQQLLFDSFGRHHTYLRLSLTDACNLRCSYCMPSELVSVTPSQKLMQLNEIIDIAETFVKFGIKKIRLTGGEPLVRKDAKEIIKQLSKLNAELSISTNGILVDQFIDVFTFANIHSVNLSLDTLNAEDFLLMTKRGGFDKILKNIQLLLSHNFRVKVNMVVMKGINEHSIIDFVEWTKYTKLDVRFIEFMPFSGNKWEREKVVSKNEMLSLISEKFTFEKLDDAPHDTAKHYKAVGHIGTFAFITTVTEPFCDSCNRLRLTADGKIKNCLFSQTETDILSAYRNGEDISSLILTSVYDKKKELGGRQDFENIENRSMIKIGG